MNRLIRASFLKAFSLLLLSMLLVQCAGRSYSLDVLEEVSDDAPKDEQSVASPSFNELNSLLESLGYDGVGLEFESQDTLNMLKTVFKDASSHERDIKLIYTGFALIYDKKYKSLTVGGTFEPTKVLEFIKKQVPKRKS